MSRAVYGTAKGLQSGVVFHSGHQISPLRGKVFVKAGSQLSSIAKQGFRDPSPLNMTCTDGYHLSGCNFFGVSSDDLNANLNDFL